MNKPVRYRVAALVKVTDRMLETLTEEGRRQMQRLETIPTCSPADSLPKAGYSRVTGKGQGCPSQAKHGS